MNGIINVYKEKGFTSHDVVAKLRGILRTKKIGHTGTLDPDATGVLPVCIGKATKLCGLLTDKDKTYQAKVKLGVTTDTLDMTGKILSEAKVVLSEQDLQQILPEFTGNLMQIPPMYSAIKMNGKKLYELARKGQEIERKPRPITIHSLCLLESNLSENEFTIEVCCSKGTYIRSLCDDIGKRLGCGAALKNLIRTRVDKFCIEQAYFLSEIEIYAREEKVAEIIQPIDSVFFHYEKLEVQLSGMKRLMNGNPLEKEQGVVFDKKGKTTEPQQGRYYRTYNQEGVFYALYRFEEKENRYYIVKMFHE